MRSGPFDEEPMHQESACGSHSSGASGAAGTQAGPTRKSAAALFSPACLFWCFASLVQPDFQQVIERHVTQ
ncbi:hypothetical protein TorRG33x02_237330 [Trema orientale]|uniref:Uncharacterized protein n=1 Tax=Trema orientale TaxID=63057 RepID=A0A2P5DZH6_TREOI|nr:hypothetical protein TorRG33x02_237330 [Trema orientale]